LKQTDVSEARIASIIRAINRLDDEVHGAMSQRAAIFVFCCENLKYRIETI
jgi:hypothetical protein